MAKQVIASPIQLNHSILFAGKTSAQATLGVNTEQVIDGKAAQAALQQLAARLDILRTSLTQDDHGVLWQNVASQVEVSLNQLDWQTLDSEQITAQQQKLCAAFIERNDTQPWLNLTIAQLPQGQCWIHLSLPASNSDVFSLNRLMAFVLDEDVRQAMLQCDEDELVQYEDLAEWLNAYLLDDELEQVRQYWQKETLACAFNPQFGLAHYQREQGQDYDNIQLPLTELVAPMQALAQRHDANLSEVVCAGLRQVMADVAADGCLSRVMDSRNDEDLADAIGPLSRVLPIFADKQPSLSAQLELERQLSQQSLEYIECFSRPAKFEKSNMAFVFQSLRYAHQGVVSTIGGLIEPAKLQFTLVEQGDNSFLSVDFDTRFVAKATLTQWLKLWHQDMAMALGLPGVVATPVEPLAGPEVSHQGKGSVVAWFEQSVPSAKGKVISPDNSEMDLSALNDKANQLANHLTTLGVGRGAQVAIRLAPSADFIVAMLAVAKTGAAYIPIDTQLPPTRVASMLQAPEIKWLISDERLDECPVEQLLLSELSWTSLAVAFSAAKIQPEDTAYVLYTSGSTGKAKGVKISHKALLNHMAWMHERFGYQERDVFLQRTSVSFDASVWECWSPLLAGATMVIMDKEGNYDLGHMLSLIQQNRVSVLQMVPSQLEVLLEQSDVASVDSLRWLFCGGEALKTSVAANANTTFGCEVINLYGPSECCIDATYFAFDRLIDSDYVPIGKPVDNMRYLVVKDDGRYARVGETGELWLGGDSVFSGYQGQPELTELAITEVAGERYYKTGDFVRILPDGHLYFLERLDNQVKLNGFRIELEEIATLVEHHQLAAQAVCVCDKQSVSLSLFVRHASADAAQIKQLLSAHLPEYMVPELVQALDEFPRLANGKIDTKALRAMAQEMRHVPYVAPSNETERKLAEIWQSALEQSDPVGVNSDFFTIGGHSLVAIKVISRVVEHFGIKLTVHDLFECSTIASLALRMQEKAEQADNVQTSHSDAIVAMDTIADDDIEEFEL